MTDAPMAYENVESPPSSGPARRDFLFVATAATGTVTVGAAVWPLINSMNPSADVTALSSVDVDLAGVEPGARITVSWQNKPVFIDHRTESTIASARAADLDDMPDPELDAERVQHPEWLVVIGVCTHLGCIPLGQGRGDPLGDWGGWFCPCHGSHYDVSGRIRRGPAPRNLDLPPYSFVSEATIRIG